MYDRVIRKKIEQENCPECKHMKGWHGTTVGCFLLNCNCTKSLADFLEPAIVKPNP